MPRAFFLKRTLPERRLTSSVTGCITIGDARRSPMNPAEGSVRDFVPEVLLLTTDEVADILRTSRKAVYVMAARGFLPGVVRVGRRVLIRRDELLDWLRESRAPSPRR